MTAVIDGFISYRFLRILTRPWHKQDAFKYGIIDKNGVALRKSKDLDKKSVFKRDRTQNDGKFRTPIDTRDRVSSAHVEADTQLR